MMTGTDAAPAATASAASGVSNRKANSTGRAKATRSASFPGQAVRQVARQGHRQVRVGAQLHIIHVLLPAAALQGGKERPHLRQVAVAQSTRVREQVRLPLQAAEQRRRL